MPEKITLLLFSAFILFLSPLFSDEPAERQVRVAVERAPVHAEANPHSYRIETLKKGAIISVFEMGTPDPEWLYVRYRSQRWRNVVTGFIRASMVEEMTDRPKEAPKAVEPPEKLEMEKDLREEKPVQVSVEEVLVASPLLSPHLLSLPQVREKEEEPRIFLVIETRPPQEKIEVPPKKKAAEDVLPEIEKPAVKPEKIEPVTVKESMGVSSLPPSASYLLPDAEWQEEPRAFMTIEVEPGTTEGQKQERPSLDITEKIPEKLEDRHPPEKEQIVPRITPDRPPQPKKPKLPGEETFLTLSAGYGPSQGSGLGGALQLNIIKGLSFHLGAGYYPASYYYSEYDWVKNKILYSLGVKYYLPFGKGSIRPYLDLQYGGISVEAVRIVTGVWYYQYIYENIQKTLYGPSVLAGVELKLGSIGLNGAVGLSYNLTEWDYWERDYFLTAEVGLLLYLW